MTANHTSRAAALTDTIMEQAQVYASAWSLIDGPFDHGNALATAEHEKAELHNLVGKTVETLEQHAAARVRPSILDAADVLRDAVQANSMLAIGIVHGITSLASGKPIAPLSLEGLRRAILTPRAIVRDQDGMLSHPAVPYLDEDVNYETFFAAFGIEAAFIHMENDVDGDTYDRYFASNNANCSFWTPSAPTGDGWLLIEIYDTEDGPVALYVREKKSESIRDRSKREAGEGAATTNAVRDVLSERDRQIEQEGHSREDDDIYNDQGQLSYAAAGLAVLASNAATDVVCGLTGGLTYADDCIGSPDPWPHGWQYKPATPRRNLVKAAAMIVAEIERIDRATASAGDAS
ncbi:hypothetical protein L810_1156 [Burkholderia sp. AU4i]|uniref:hypothetical protein n=1 Tax=Burkholderia sp. AU4i TaxID=1335308 RepID=UPI000398D02C|nr:hypothetical protein [Burkholderia sp. AU4i]ERJ35899.1 hypothetical protein L810_1156 [Burkholderia sp. AU4i]